VWLAIRLLRDAGIEIKGSASSTDAAAANAMIEREVERVLRSFSPGSARVRTLSQLEDGRPLYPVSFAALTGLTTQDGVYPLFGSPYGAKAPQTKKLLQALNARITALGNEVGFYAGGSTAAGPLWNYRARAMGTGEDMGKAVERWVEESKQREAARAAARTAPASTSTSTSTSTASTTPALTMSIPTSNYPSGTMTAQAGPGGASVSMQDGAATGGQPAWLMPALIGTAVAGVALLLLPDGSGNRGSRARGFGYGRTNRRW
jgi:hypothetical protein